MEYLKAETVLPPELLREVQRYVDGRAIYIPRTAGARRGWGEKTAARETLRARDEAIYRDYREGLPADRLAEKYFLSRKSIERIVTRMRREGQDE